VNKTITFVNLNFKTMRQTLKSRIEKGAEEVSEALLKFNLKGAYKKVVLIIFLFLFNVSVSTPGAMGEGQETMTHPKETKEAMYIRTVKDKIETDLYNEVEKYILSMAPDSKLSSELLVDKCLEYKTDIIFVLAQALLESHFGTKGKAAATNSVWNVGTYDNGKILYTYDDPNQSLEPYLKLINEKYLINVTEKGDTIYRDIYHLTQDRGYINYDGKRFASARGYENALRKLMIRIDMETSINFYQGVLILPDDKLLAYFSPLTDELNSDQYVALR